jgi:hypothetical protein
MFDNMIKIMCKWKEGIVTGMTKLLHKPSNGGGQRRPSCVKVSVIVAEGYGQRIGVLLLVSKVDYEILQWHGSAPKKNTHVFRSSLRPIPIPTSFPSSSAARKPISKVIPLDHLRKMNVVNVSNVRERWAGW